MRGRCGTLETFVFFCCIAELAIKPCPSSRSKLRGEFGIPKHLQNRKQKHNKATNTPNPKHNTKQKEHGKCLEGETRGEKRVKRPKRPNALIYRTPGGSIRYPSCSLGMTLISHSIVSIPASPSSCSCMRSPLQFPSGLICNLQFVICFALLALSIRPYGF